MGGVVIKVTLRNPAPVINLEWLGSIRTRITQPLVADMPILMGVTLKLSGVQEGQWL